MTAFTTATLPLHSQTVATSVNRFGTSVNSLGSELDADTRALSSVLGRTLFFLGLGTVGVVAITGQPPLFFIPFALFLLVGLSLKWTRSSEATASLEAHRSRGLVTSSARSQPFTGYEDKA